ncbi:MAG: hypothetical protein IPN80_13775 [Flavobacterium sp.]|nr:hypothetical protein [Flavobacterium sp.]
MGSIFKLIIVLVASIGGSYLVLKMFKIISDSREKSNRIDDISSIEYSKKSLSEPNTVGNSEIF